MIHKKKIFVVGRSIKRAITTAIEEKLIDNFEILNEKLFADYNRAVIDGKKFPLKMFSDKYEMGQMSVKRVLNAVGLKAMMKVGEKNWMFG